MQFDAGTWWLIGILLTALLGVCGLLVSRSVFGKLDENYKDIKQIRQDYTPRSEHTADVKAVREELKSDIKNVRDELRSETRKLASDIEDIKENCLRKDDFIRAMTDSNSKVAAVDHKIDKLLEMMISNGGTRNG